MGSIESPLTTSCMGSIESPLTTSCMGSSESPLTTSCMGSSESPLNTSSMGSSESPRLGSIRGQIIPSAVTGSLYIEFPWFLFTIFAVFVPLIVPQIKDLFWSLLSYRCGDMVISSLSTSLPYFSRCISQLDNGWA